jgi:predicted Zn-dependent peptidase
LIIVGDVDPEQIRSLSGEYFGSWIGSSSVVDNFRVDAQTRERRVWILDRPGSVQSEVRLGHVGVARTTPNYLPLSIGNLLLGGTFTSRLNLNLRERNGFTYGVRSRFSFRSQPGPFQVSTAVGNEVTASAVREILSELESLVIDGVTREEVDAARDYAAGVFGLHLETAGQIASRLNQILVYGLPDDYYHLYRDSIRSVSTEEVTSAVKAHIRPDEVQVVIVGDADSISGSVDALGLGPLEVV